MSAGAIVGWPVVRVQLSGVSRATVGVTGTQLRTELRARTVNGLRAAVVAWVRSQVAVELRRPVRVEVSEDTGTWVIAVSEDGTTHELDPRGALIEDRAPVFAGPCWACGSEQLVTAGFCMSCGVAGPVLPSIGDVVDGIWLTFNDQDPVQVGMSGVVLGRAPESVAGRRPVKVISPGREVSRLHAAVDVDPAGWALVTDLDSGNGVVIAHTEERLTPGEATAVPVGTSLVLGDVLCTVAVRAAVAL